jgi:hypothetical protein
MGHTLKLTDNGELHVFEAIGNGTNKITLKGPAALAADYDYILPSALPASQEFLTLDELGNVTTSPGIDPLVIPDQGSVDLRELTVNGTSAVKLQAAAAMAADYTIEFAAAAPAADAFVTISSTGVLTYVRGLPNQGGLDLTELTASGTAVLTLKANADMTADAGSYTLTFPSGVPAGDSLLQVSAAGVISYTTVAGQTLDAAYSNGQTITADAGALELSSPTGVGDLRFHNTDTTILLNDEYGAITWEGDDASTSANGVRAKLHVEASDAEGGICFEFGGAPGASTSLGPQVIFDVDTQVFQFGATTFVANPTLKVFTANLTGTGTLEFEDSGATGATLTYNHTTGDLTVNVENDFVVQSGGSTALTVDSNLDTHVAAGRVLQIGGATVDSTGSNILKIFSNATAPTNANDICTLRTTGSGATAEMVVQDAAGNDTTISPHSWGRHLPSEKMAWCYRSARGGTEVFVDMLSVIREVEALSGKSFVEIYHLDIPDPARPPLRGTPPDFNTIPGKGPIEEPIPDVGERP